MSLEHGKEKRAGQMFYFQPGGARYPCVCRTTTTTKHNNNNNNYTNNSNKPEDGIAQLVQCPIETPGAIPTRVRDRPRHGICLSESSLRCPNSTSVQWHTSCVCTSQMAHTGSHTIVWTHGNTAHADRNG